MNAPAAVLPRLARLLRLACCCSIGSGFCPGQVLGAENTLNPAGPPEPVLRALAENERLQRKSAESWKTFHDFKFTDQFVQSGIQFHHHPVDDASRDYKAVHYDHGNGLAAADVDGDGLIDLYFVNQLGESQLWRNIGGGRFENLTASAGVGLAELICVGASFADIDNDGRPDLLVTTVRQGNHLFHNLGGGRFADITAASGLATRRPAHSSGAVFFDFDRDGLLDLFVANVGNYTRNEKGRGGFYLGRADAFLGWQFPDRSEPSVLYRNLGGGKFENFGAKVGWEHRGWSGDATFADVNEDGFPDLYVLSMSGSDRLYLNDRGRGFTEQTDRYFPRTPWGSMGVKFFDFDLDGRMDLYVTDMHSDMTSAQIKAGDTDFSPGFEKQKSDVWCSTEWPASTQRYASNNILGNAFYRNEGGGRYREVSAELGAETYWPWGVTVADLNADGWEDLLVTAGMGYPLRYAVNSVLLNDGGRRFVDSEFILGVEPRPAGRVEKPFFTLDCDGADRRHPLSKGRSGAWTVLGATSSRGSVAVDLDNDGDLDLVTSDWNDRPQVLISNLARSEQRPIHYLKIRLVGTRSNRDGLGARVTVQSGMKKFVRYHDGKSGYLAQSSLPLYFGLGEASAVDQIEIQWPAGGKQVLRPGAAINTTLTVTEAP